MAGITAFFSLTKQSDSQKHLLERILLSSFPLPSTQKTIADVEDTRAAFGGVFPKHFQRATSTAKSKSGHLLFYGELYNQLGSTTEAEFALTILDTHGIAGLKDMNGPFALFHWNQHKQTLIAATDRLGRFPLFYCFLGNCICITTDLHPLFASGLITPSIDHSSLIDFLTIGFPLGENTLFEKIKSASAGEYLTCSQKGIEKTRYWKPEYPDTLNDVQPMVEVFQQCNERAIAKRPTSIVALSGGWDSRATIAALATSKNEFSAMTFGEPKSTDVALASGIASHLQLQHEVISADKDFFDSFDSLAEQVIILGNCNATIDLAFQLFAFKQLSPRYPMLLDSAGCEFRRGVRAKIAAQSASSSSDISDFLLSMYSTGIWNTNIIAKEIYEQGRLSTHSRLTHWLESLHLHSFEDEIDAFSWYELWSHHYAHGTPLQTSAIACHMPYSDNEFYDLFLQADRSIRWSHRFHQAVIKSLRPSLEQFPISYGHIRVPYGENPLRYAPMVYHRVNNKLSSISGLQWLNSFDNWRPFRPYHKWFVRQLEEYTREMLSSQALVSSGYFNTKGVHEFLAQQKSSPQDISHGISVLLTLAHLLRYITR